MGSVFAGARSARGAAHPLVAIWSGALDGSWFQRHSRTDAPGVRDAQAHIAEMNTSPERIARATAGDPFAAFVAAHEGAIFAYLWRMTGDESAAYDLRQETAGTGAPGQTMPVWNVARLAPGASGWVTVGQPPVIASVAGGSAVQGGQSIVAGNLSTSGAQVWYISFHDGALHVASLPA